MAALELQRWPLTPKPTPPTTTPFYRADENHHGFPAHAKDSVLETVTQVTAKSVSVAWVGEAPPLLWSKGGEAERLVPGLGANRPLPLCLGGHLTSV